MKNGRKMWFYPNRLKSHYYLCIFVNIHFHFSQTSCSIASDRLFIIIIIAIIMIAATT